MKKNLLNCMSTGCGEQKLFQIKQNRTEIGRGVCFSVPILKGKRKPMREYLMMNKKKIRRIKDIFGLCVR